MPKPTLNRKFRSIVMVVSMVTTLVACLPMNALAQGTSQTAANSGRGTREFMLSATYGALAGALVGGASLAFSDRPGDNLNKVARGASIGLYGGILLGLFVMYGGPGPYDDESAQNVRPKLLVAPLLTERGLEGAEARYSLLDF